VRFVDTHAHLADPAFDADRDAVVARARAAGCDAVVCIGESLAAAARARAVAAAHPGFVWYTAGVHPHDAAGFDPVDDPARLRAALAPGGVAVGECGLDYHYDHSPRDRQRRAFVAQLALARELGLPVVVHSRAAVDDTAAIVREAGQAGVRGVLHCFSGPRALADAALESGWYCSLAGVITFKKWDDDALLRALPADRLLVETDAPYLAPVPHRGHRNEPAHLVATITRLAAVRGVPADTLAEQCAANARALFGLAPAPAAA
jgi:TatD DNase family protein